MRSRLEGPSGAWRVAQAVVLLVALSAAGCAGLSSSSPGSASPAGSPATASAEMSSTPAGSDSVAGETTAPESSGPSAGGDPPPLALPDPSRTPGAIDPSVTQATIVRTICTTGYTTTVRPPASYTGTLKREQLAAWDYADTDPAHFEEDHLIPLSLGGAPRDERNLWPEPRTAIGPDGLDYGAATKDAYELWLHEQVCDGRVTLADAQHAMATDWIAGWVAAGRP